MKSTLVCAPVFHGIASAICRIHSDIFFNFVPCIFFAKCGWINVYPVLERQLSSRNCALKKIRSYTISNEIATAKSKAPCTAAQFNRQMCAEQCLVLLENLFLSFSMFVLLQ